MSVVPTTDSSPGVIDVVAVIYPEFAIFGNLREGTTIKVAQLLKHFVPDIPLPDDALEIDYLEFSASPTYQTYTLAAQIHNVWSVDLSVTTLTIDMLNLSLALTKNDADVDFIGRVIVFNVGLFIEAKHQAGAPGWTFSGRLDPTTPIKIADLVDQFIAKSYPGGATIDLSGKGLDGLEITALGMSFETSQKTYSFDGAAQWAVPLGGEGTLTVTAAVAVTKTSGQPASGKISAGLFVNDAFFGNLAVVVYFQFQPGKKDLGFILKKGGLELDADLSYGEGQDTILKVSLGGTTVGDILTFLVNLVDPYLDFKLDAPWDILNSFRLDQLALVINLTKKTVGVTYTGSINLGFMTITTLGLTYETVNGESTVNITLAGTFLGAKLDNPLKWDALNDAPPAVPGKGGGYLDLRYLGLGQHVALASTAGLGTMTAAIAALESTVIPVSSTAGNPLTQPELGGLVFNAGSGWLIGAKFVVLDTVEIDIIFNDPLIYGLLVRLYGEKAKIFAGLSFEILYRKISDTIGVYHIELKLPDAMRNLEFGEVSITLPVVALDIYTNGDFRIDVGFPANGDFSRSFALQAFPFVGAGGFYFAKLSAATATDLPAITNGVFNPVIEFGIGLRIGLGKDINEGILSAGFSIVVQGIFEGTLAWFHPTDTTKPTDMYYRLQGTFAIVGRLYGEINFAIIQARLDVTVYAGVRATIEAYQPILIDLVAGVSVRVSVKILFISIHFSFNATIRQHFAIGSAKPTPWVLAASAPAPRATLLAGAPAPFGVRMARLTIVTEAAPTTLNWAPLAVWAKSKTLDLIFQPSFTAGLAADGRTAEGKGVALLFLENALPFADTPPASLPAASGPASDPFTLLAQSILAWAVHALLEPAGAPVAPPANPCQDADNTDPTFSDYVEQTTVSLADLGQLYGLLAGDDGAQPALFGVQDLQDFFATNFCCNITVCQANTSATFFPIFPQLSLTPGGAPRIDFSQPPVPDGYLQTVRDFVQALAVDYQRGVAGDPAQTAPPQAAALDGAAPVGLSMAGFIFQDYFAIVARSVVQAAIDYLAAQPSTTGTLAALLTGLATGATLHNTAGMVSRFLLHGLRLPAPAGGPATAPVYELTGQQFSLPAPVTAGYQLTLTNTGGLPWLQFTQPALDGKAATASATELVYALSPAEAALASALAAATFAPTIQTLAPLPLYQLVDKRFTFQHNIGWQAADPPILCTGQAAPAPTLWQFPANLLDELSGLAGTPLRLSPWIGTPTQTGARALQTDPVQTFGWATTVPIRLRMIPVPGGTLPNTYLLLGTDETGRHLLEDLLGHLSTLPASGGSTLHLHLLYQPSINSSTLQSTGWNNSLLLKSNLSTLSTSGQPQPQLVLTATRLVDTNGNPYSATADDAAAFIRLLWECSVVGTGGYYLNYRPADAAATLPDFLFADDQTAALSLVAIFEPTTGQDVPALHTDVYRFHNAIVIKDAIDTATAVLFATAADTQVKTAVVPPGTVGFQLLRTPQAAEDPQVTTVPVTPQTALAKLDYLYTLLGYQVNGNAFFRASSEGLPVGPADSTTDETGASLAADGVWRYERVVPISPLALSGVAPGTANPYLPPPDQDPYAGIAEGAAVNLGLAFHDLFGNREAGAAAVPALPNVPVGYTDPVIGLAQWPSVTTTYHFATAGATAATLAIAAHFEPGQYLSGPGTPLSRLRQQISADRTRYAQIYYQVHQQDAGCTLSTTVTRSQPYTLDKGPFATLATQAYQYLATILGVQPGVYQVPTTGTTTLTTVSQAYYVAISDLAASNSATVNLFTPGTPLRIPCFYRVRAGDTLEDIAARLGNGATAASLAANAATTLGLLRTGTLINTASAARTATYTLQGGETLADIARKFTNARPGDIATANAARPLTGGVTIALRDSQIAVAAGDTLADLVSSYNTAQKLVGQPNALSAYEFGAGNASTVPDLFQAQVNGAAVTLQIPLPYQIATGDTLARIATAYGAQLGDIVASNPGNTTLLVEGALITVATEAYATQNGDSLDLIVQRANATIASDHPLFQPIAVADLATANAEVQLSATPGPDPARPASPPPVPLLLPNQLALDLPSPSGAAVHSIDAKQDTLQTIAGANRTVAGLIAANEDLGSLLAPGQPVTVAGITLPVRENETFRTLLARVNSAFVLGQPAFAALKASGVPDALLAQLAPLQDHAYFGQAEFLAAIQQLTSAQATALYQPALLQYGGQAVTPPRTLADLATALGPQQGLLVDKQLLVVPPGTAQATVTLDLTGQPYPNAPIFPVTAELTLARAATLIHPDFRDAPEVQSATVVLAPNPELGSPTSAATLREFATGFEAAFALKLATGSQQALRHPENFQAAQMEADPADDAQPRQLWAVNLAAGGLRYTITTGKPFFFAVAPLATTLLGTPAPIAIDRYDSGNPVLQTDQPRSFQAIDLAVWARDFLGAIDGFLDPAVAVPAINLGGAALASTVQILNAKGDLADAIASQVQPIYSYPTSDLATFNDIAGYFAVDTGYLATAIPQVPGIFRTTTISAKGKTYPATATDSLDSVAAGLGLADAATLLEAIGATTGLVDPDAAGAAVLAALTAPAAEALRQRLLIALSSAYAVDAVVQYGVQVTSPSPDKDTAPRLSGQPVARGYTTSADDTLQQISATFAPPMPPAYTAATIGMVQNLLQPGAAVDGYTIQGGDTLVSLARQLGKTLAELANPAQTPQQRFFKPGVHVPLAQLTLSTPAQATLNTLARYFETTPDEVLVANQDVAGLFQAHQEITAPGHDPYTVQPNDTPALVARAIWGDASDPSLASLSQTIAIQAGLIAGNIPVGILRLTPDATLSSAKVPLNDGTSFLTFLFTTKAPASESRVFLDLDYRINEMEYDLGSLPGIAGYQASSWLSFVLPIEATDARYGAPLGQVEIPVPLRSYPTPPSLIAQQVEQTPPRQLAEVKQWQYSYTYEHLDAAQDTIETGVRYNLPPKNGPARALAAGAPPARNLFEALANFTQVYPELEPDLRGLTAQQPPPAASAAVVAFQTLVTEVATAWRAWLEAVQPAGATTADYTFDIAQTTPDEHGIVSVTVTATGGTAPDVGLLPVIQLPGYTPVTAARVAATATANAAAEYQFQLPADPAQLPPIPQATVLMPAFDVLLRQNAWGAVWLTRNRNLSPSAVTNPAFVYQTPAIGFTNNAVPLLIDNTEWAIGEVAVSGGALDQAGLQGLLQTIFDQILPSAAPAPHIVRLSCSYAFSLSQNSQGDDLRATVPVILVPQVALAAQSPQLQTVIDNVATAIVSWHQQHQPSTASGCYMFSLGVFSNLGAGDQNNLQPPLLQVNELTIALIPGA